MALLFQGAANSGSCFSTQFDGFHFSMQTELVVMRMGYAEAKWLGSFSHITFVADSQPTFLGLQRFGGGPSLALEALEAVRTLEGLTHEFRLWWTLNHIGLLENDLVDEAAKVAAQGLAPVDVCKVPLCKAALKIQLAGLPLSGTFPSLARICNRSCHTSYVMCSGRGSYLCTRCH